MTLRRPVFALLATLVAACGIVGGHNSAALATTTGGVSLRPGQVDEADPITRSYFKLTMAPGATHRGTVVVANSAPTAAKLLVSSVDGLTGVTSGAVYANRQDVITRAAAWVTPDLSAIVVPPQGTVEVGFTVRIPADARAGDHLAGIAFEFADPVVSPGAFAITEIIRSVIGVHVMVPGDARFAMRVDDITIAADRATGAPHVTVMLANSGWLLGKPSLSLELSSPGGYRRVVARDLDTVLPGDSIPLIVAWPDALPAGAYTAQVRVGVATGADAAVVTKDLRLTSDIGDARAVPVAAAAVAPKPAPTSTERGVTVSPALLVVALATTCFAFFAGRLRTTRRRRDGATVPRART